MTHFILEETFNEKNPDDRKEKKNRSGRRPFERPFERSLLCEDDFWGERWH